MICWQVQHIIFNEIPTMSSLSKKERETRNDKERFIMNCHHSRIKQFKLCHGGKSRLMSRLNQLLSFLTKPPDGQAMNPIHDLDKALISILFKPLQLTASSLITDNSTYRLNKSN
jgi:hypothetical protein